MNNPFKHFTDDYGITAWVATLVIVGAFIVLWKVADNVDPDTLVALVGGWISSIVTAIVVIKSAKKPKE